MKHRITVELETSTNDVDEVAAYVADAVLCWGGSYPPDSPFFDLPSVNVTKTELLHTPSEDDVSEMSSESEPVSLSSLLKDLKTWLLSLISL